MSPFSRKSNYIRDGWNEKLEVIQGWARDGLTNEQIAENMGISHDTLYKYKKRYSEFAESLKKGKEVVDRQVENALFKRAIGYETTEITKENGVIAKEVIKEVKPDVVAQIFWLKNRKPEHWRDKKEIDANVENSGEVNVKFFSSLDLHSE